MRRRQQLALSEPTFRNGLKPRSVVWPFEHDDPTSCHCGEELESQMSCRAALRLCDRLAARVRGSCCVVVEREPHDLLRPERGGDFGSTRREPDLPTSTSQCRGEMARGGCVDMLSKVVD